MSSLEKDLYGSAEWSAEIAWRGSVLGATIRYEPSKGISFHIPAGAASEKLDEMREISILSGKLMTGEPFSLIGCRLTRTRPGMDTAFVADSLLTGGSIPSLDVQLIAGMRVRSKSFYPWRGNIIHSYDLKQIADDFGKPNCWLDLSAEGTELKGFEFLGGSSSPGSFRIQQETTLRLKFSSLLSLNEARRELEGVQMFMSLMCGYSFGFQGVLMSGALSGQPVQFSYWSPTPEAERGIEPSHDVFLPEIVLRSQLGAAWGRWRTGWSQYETPVRLFMMTEPAGERPVAEFQFLTIMQALESLHRNRFPGLYMAKEAYVGVANEICGKLPSSLVGDHRSSFKTRGKFGNEYSLRKRLKDLLEKQGLDSPEVFGAGMKNFLGRTVDARNYLTHYSTESAESALSTRDLWRAIYVLRHLFQAAILVDLGVEVSAIKERLRSDYLTRQLVEFLGGGSVSSTSDS